MDTNLYFIRNGFCLHHDIARDTMLYRRDLNGYGLHIVIGKAAAPVPPTRLDEPLHVQLQSSDGTALARFDAKNADEALAGIAAGAWRSGRESMEFSEIDYEALRKYGPRQRP